MNELNITLGETGLTVTANAYLLGIAKATGIPCPEIGVTGLYSGDFAVTPNVAGTYEIAFFAGSTLAVGSGELVWDGVAEVTPPELGDEPITLDEAGSNLRASMIDGVYVEAALILRLITASRQACEDYLEVSLVTKTLTVTQDSFYPARIELPNGPVTGIVSVTYVDSNGSDVVLGSDQYRLSTSGRMAVLWPAYGVTWPSARCDVDSVRVVYTAGYPTADEGVPETVRQAMLLYIGHYCANRDAVDVDTLAELPLGVKALLDPDRQGLGV